MMLYQRIASTRAVPQRWRKLVVQIPKRETCDLNQQTTIASLIVEEIKQSFRDLLNTGLLRKCLQEGNGSLNNSMISSQVPKSTFVMKTALVELAGYEYVVFLYLSLIHI